MRKLFVSLCLLTGISAAAFAQGPRLFLDLPNIYFVTPDAQHVGNNLGAGLGTAFNIATHNMTARVGGGANFTVDPQSNDFEASFAATPYILLEAGAGMYRSNGNRCAKTKQNAFTALAKFGLRNDFILNPPAGAAKNDLQYGPGMELGYFFIRDVFKNYEVVLDANYMLPSKTIYATFGLKMFLNLRAGRYK